MQRERPDRYLLLYLLVEVGFGAAFPRFSYRLRWYARLSRRGTAAYIACRTALGMVFGIVLHERVLPWAKRMAEEKERLRKQLTEQLGREPTDDEIVDYRFEQLRRVSEADGDADAEGLA